MLPLAYASGVWVDVRPRTLRGFRVSMTWATCTMVLLFDAHGCPSPPISQTDWPMSWPLLAKMAPHGTASWHCMCEVPPPQHLQSRAILDPDKRVLSQTDKKHYKTYLGVLKAPSLCSFSTNCSSAFRSRQEDPKAFSLSPAGCKKWPVLHHQGELVEVSAGNQQFWLWTRADDHSRVPKGLCEVGSC